MKTTLEETLAKIRQDAMASEHPDHFTNWAGIDDSAKAAHYDGIKAVLDHLASMEVPSVNGLWEAYTHASGIGEDSVARQRNGIEAVRTACMAPLCAKIAVLEGRLEAVKALVKDWRNVAEIMPKEESFMAGCKCQLDECIEDLEQALSTPAPQVPEIPKAEEKPQNSVRFMSDDPAGDWTEDFPHENGNYCNRCLHCEKQFIGHKRRISCKKCSIPVPALPEGYTPHKAGDSCPCSPKTEVSVFLTSGKTLTAPAENVLWGDGSGVIGWCNVEKPQHHQPPAGLTLHNPDNLTPEQVGEGYRLPTTIERCIGKIQQWRKEGWDDLEFEGTFLFGEMESTYRLPIFTPWPEVKAEEKPEKWAAEKAAHAKRLKIEWKTQGMPEFTSVAEPRWYPEDEYRIAPGQQSDPYADLKSAAEAGKWMQFKDIGGTWWIPEKKADWHFERLVPLGRLRVLTTTVHDGKTYFDHRPGDEMPVGGDVEVAVFLQVGYAGHVGPAKDRDWTDKNQREMNIIGYYPTSLALALGNVEKPKVEEWHGGAAKAAAIGAQIAEVASQPSTFEQDGVVWLSHKPGDPCPVDWETVVEVLFDDKETRKGKAGNYGWGRNPTPEFEPSIIGYRLVPQPEQDKPDALLPGDTKTVYERELENRIKWMEEVRGQNEAEIARLKDCLFHAQEAAKEQTQRVIAAENKLKQIAFFVS